MKLTALCAGGLLAALVVATTALGQSPVVYSQSPPDPTLGARNSNTPSNTITTQQIADDFLLNQPGLLIDQIDLWNHYGFGPRVPATQDFVINVYDDVAGDPGNLVFTQTATTTPIDTGVQTIPGGNTIYKHEVALNPTFNPQPGTTYWLSPLGDIDDVNWSWQFHNATGSRRSRPNGTSGWRTFSSDLTFDLRGVPEPSTLLLLGLGGLAITRRRG